MKKYDVVIVGAGPAGSITAKFAAKSGAEVLMIEKRQEIGSPVRCGEGFPRHWLDEVGIRPDDKWIANEVEGARIFSPDGSCLTIDHRIAGREVGTVVERDLFDKALASDAALAGADIMVKTSATDLIKKNGKITGVKAIHLNERFDIEADIVVGADGFESQVGRWAGIDTSLKTSDISTCLQYRMVGVDCNPDYCDFFIKDVSKGYVWVFPKGKGCANVGVGILLNKIKDKGEVKAFLDDFVKTQPEYSKGKVVDMVAGAVSTCAPIDRTVTDGLLLVGDAARQVDPMTGGGIANACLAGKVAGEVCGEAVQKGDFSAEFLNKYEKGWRKRLEAGLYRNWIAKEKLMTLGNDTINKIVSSLAEVGVQTLSILEILQVIQKKHPELIKELEDLL